MTDRINELLRQIEAFEPKIAAEVEDFRIRILGKKGELNVLMEEFKSVSPRTQTTNWDQQLNRLKTTALDRINTLRETLQDAAAEHASEVGDKTRPGSAEPLGSRHPISLMKNRIVEVFSRLGYTVADGPEIEDDWHVFRPSTSRPSIRPAICRTRSSSRKTPTSCCVRIHHRFKCA